MAKKSITQGILATIFFVSIATNAMEQKKLLDENENLTSKKIESKKEEKKDQKKKHAHILRQLKIEKQKEELDAIWEVLKDLQKQFNRYEENNTPYDDLVKKFYGLLSQNQQKSGSIPFDPEKLLTVGLTYTGLTDFIVHAVMAYVGFKYTTLITSSSVLNEPLTSGINTNQQFALPWPKKKFQFLVPDNIEGKPIFSPDGSLLAVEGSKCITIFSTVTGKKMGQCKKLFEGIQLLRFYVENPHQNTIGLLVKTEDGLTLFELGDGCNSSDSIPSVALLKTKEELKETKNITKLGALTTSSLTVSSKKKRLLKTPRGNKQHENNIIYTSLPEKLSVGSFLPPYSNRFGVIKKIGASLAFMDLDLNKLFPPEKNEEVGMDKSDSILSKKSEYTPFGQVSENGLYGLISTTKKTLDLYGFLDMFPPKEWLLIFCMRYGKYQKPLDLTGSWCSVYHTLNEKERDYLDKTYSFSKPKKKTWSGSIPTLDLEKVLKNKSELDFHSHTDRKK